MRVGSDPDSSEEGREVSFEEHRRLPFERAIGDTIEGKRQAQPIVPATYLFTMWNYKRVAETSGKVLEKPKERDGRKMKQKRKRENPMKGIAGVEFRVVALVPRRKGQGVEGEKSRGKRMERAGGEKKPDERRDSTMWAPDIGVFSFVTHYRPFFFLSLVSFSSRLTSPSLSLSLSIHSFSVSRIIEPRGDEFFRALQSILVV